jgi:hypothetical protein
MSRQELSRFLDWYCGCGAPWEAAAALLRLLRLHPLYEHRTEFDAWIRDDGVQYWLLYHLDHLGLTEHGTNVNGAWLTKKGEQVRDALGAIDDLETWLSGTFCSHGYRILDENNEPDEYDHKCV